MKDPISSSSRPKGFALVVTLTLMVLLTILSLGLLSLATITLRTSAGEDEMQSARANARLALHMAIAQLQENAGDDRRITMAADQLDDGNGETAALEGYRHWTGVYKSWPNTLENRPEPEHLAWLVSQPDNFTEDTPLGALSIPMKQMVGEGTVGDNASRFVSVPLLDLPEEEGRFAWWTADQGLKAAISSPIPESISAPTPARINLQSPAMPGIEFAADGTVKPFTGMDRTDERLTSLASWGQADFFASQPAAGKPLFHDLAVSSKGLLVNVRKGGFRKDLSALLEKEPEDRPVTPLYEINGDVGINMEELWAFYNLYKELKTDSSPYLTGGTSIPSGTECLVFPATPTLSGQDYFVHFKMPAVISYQTLISFRAIKVGSNPDKYRLQLVVDPIVTLWNPNDVPIVFPVSNFLTVTHWPNPYTLKITVNGTEYICPLLSTLTGSTLSSTSDHNYLGLRVGDAAQSKQLVFRPGEVVKFSQAGDKIGVTNGISDSHNLVGFPGFNFGAGLALDIKDENGTKIEITTADPDTVQFTYTAEANGYTAGKTSSSGGSLRGSNLHSRHFSLVHRNTFIGRDRTDSQGMGGIMLDFDFGNDRVSRESSPRQIGTRGTKPSGDRLYANNYPNVFKPLAPADARPIILGAALTEKQAAMLFSFNAKTENGANRTKSLPRYNPRAELTDIYSFEQEDLDLISYEYEMKPIVSNTLPQGSIDNNSDGQGFFGGSHASQDGVSFINTYSIPHEPVISLAAFQHSSANGFLSQKIITGGYVYLNARLPMLPQISHAIGNSAASAMLDSAATSKMITGGRVFADHSYLANRALWDDWFLSGLAPQTASGFSSPLTLDEVATKFFAENETALNPRYLPETGSADKEALKERFMEISRNVNDGADDALAFTAAHITVDGLFNVNSTSVEAWKAMLSATNGSARAIYSSDGEVTSETATPGEIAVPGLLSSGEETVKSTDASSVKSKAQWNGSRILTEGEIDDLANSLVKEVRARGPFLSLSDFINRRPGSDKVLAKSGALQSALDDPATGINANYTEGARSVSASISARMEFPEAEEGAISEGIPGVIKQADILTNLGPVLSVRSDTFVIRAYGESLDKDGNVLASAWCEATVQRGADFVDEADAREVPLDMLIKEENKTYGRRFQIVSFRWMSPAEI